jgi:hypothetical protein
MDDRVYVFRAVVKMSSSKSTEKIATYLGLIGACVEARTWVGDRTVEQAWAECERGDWLIWILARTGRDTSAIGYWCAERARQSALRVLPDSPARSALASCAPITDRASALIARFAAADAAYSAAAAAAAAAATAAYSAYAADAAADAAAAATADDAADVAAADAAYSAYAAATAADDAAAAYARRSELKATADYVRTQFACPEIQ